MIVCAIVPQYVPWSRVGAWITTHEYLAGLAARGHHVDVIVASGRVVDPYDIDGVHVHPSGTDVDRPNVIVSHLGDTSYGAALAERLAVPSVRMVHGYDQRNAERLDTRPTALAVFASEALRTDTGWDGRAVVAHPPVRAADYRVRPGKLVTLSNLNAEKGGGLLGRIAERLPDRQFLGVRGWGYQYDRQPPNVRVIDPVWDVREVYRQTRILLVPSKVESYGRVGVEAAASGIPTIAHPSPGLVEALGDAATWVDRWDLTGWIDTIRHLATDRDAWREASARARRANQTDPDATVARVVEAIEGLA